MKMIRNNKTGAEFVLTDQMKKRALREGVGGSDKAWTIFELGVQKSNPGDEPRIGDPVADQTEPQGTQEPETDQEPEPEPETDDDSEPELPDDGLQDLRSKVIAMVEKTDAIEKAKDRKDALAEIALENLGLKVDKRKGVDDIRAEVMAVATGQAEVPALEGDEED